MLIRSAKGHRSYGGTSGPSLLRHQEPSSGDASSRGESKNCEDRSIHRSFPQNEVCERLEDICRGGRGSPKSLNRPANASAVGVSCPRSSAQLFALAVLSSAARRPLASLTASSFAQKCMKKSRGCSSSMWLCTAVTSMPFVRSALITGFTSSPVSTKSPVMAALPPPVGWKLMPSPRPSDRRG